MSGKGISEVQSAEAELLRLDVDRERIERELADIALHATPPLDPRLRPAVEYALWGSGKRLRPILVVQAYRVARGDPEVPDALFRLACALEIVHVYSLVHDDLPCMDDDDLRRGRPTVHRVHGCAEATLAGAALLPIAVATLAASARSLGVEAPLLARLVSELTDAAGAEGMVGGQLLDLEAEGRTISGAELEEIHSRKTGALLTCSLRIGALCAGADAEVLARLTRYGRALGLAFQIADDVLDVQGSSTDLGKTAGRDQALKKASYPSIHGLEGARELARAKVAEAKAALGDLEAPGLFAIADYVIERRT